MSAILTKQQEDQHGQNRMNEDRSKMKVNDYRGVLTGLQSCFTARLTSVRTFILNMAGNF